MPPLGAPVPEGQQGQTAAAAGIPQAPQQAAPATAPKPNSRQIEHLRANPSLAPDFDEMFGRGASAVILGAR